MTSVNSNIRCALIPHAGIQYAGDARKSAFQHFNGPDTKVIIYIATNHKPSTSNITYILYNNSKYKLPKDIYHKPIPYENEHSFKWVHDELTSYFTNAKILAIGPNQYNKKLKQWIVHFMKNTPKCILLATTDLTHYGDIFNNSLMFKFPQQLYKQRYEEEFISSLTRKPLNIRIVNRLLRKQDLMCGPMATQLFIQVCNGLNYTGKVVDYYDSYGIENNPDSNRSDLLNRYIIQPNNIEHFVSYVSIVYGSGINQNKINQFDILMGIGLVKSVMLRYLYKKYNNINHYNLKLPKWSPFYSIYSGVFVGTNIGTQTNCSYGRYENRTQTTAMKIRAASNDCPGDANNRWHTPYSLHDIGSTQFKIELLQPKKEWKTYKGVQAYQQFKIDGKHGLYLTLPSERSATYLPVVARDNLDWTVDQYMRRLVRKAGGNGDEWKEGTIQIYTSTSYTWNPDSQKLEIF